MGGNFAFDMCCWSCLRVFVFIFYYFFRLVFERSKSWMIQKIKNWKTHTNMLKFLLTNHKLKQTRLRRLLTLPASHRSTTTRLPFQLFKTDRYYWTLKIIPVLPFLCCIILRDIPSSASPACVWVQNTLCWTAGYPRVVSQSDQLNSRF
jgi:hypothetical protein